MMIEARTAPRPARRGLESNRRQQAIGEFRKLSSALTKEKLRPLKRGWTAERKMKDLTLHPPNERPDPAPTLVNS